MRAIRIGDEMEVEEDVPVCYICGEPVISGPDDFHPGCVGDGEPSPHDPTICMRCGEGPCQCCDVCKGPCRGH